MAQAFGVHDIFEKDAVHLIQEIELKHKPVQAVAPLPPLPVYDARLMTKPPSKRSKPEDVVTLMEPYIKSGLKLEIDDNVETWTMRYLDRVDTGTMRMPMRTFLNCARKIMQ